MSPSPALSQRDDLRNVAIIAAGKEPMQEGLDPPRHRSRHLETEDLLYRSTEERGALCCPTGPLRD